MNEGLYLAKKHPMRTYFIYNTEYSLMFEEKLSLIKPQKSSNSEHTEIIALIPRLEVTNRGLDQTIVIHECGNRSTGECIEFIESHNPRIFYQNLKHFTEKDLEALTINSN